MTKFGTVETMGSQHRVPNIDPANVQSARRSKTRTHIHNNDPRRNSMETSKHDQQAAAIPPQLRCLLGAIDELSDVPVQQARI